MKIDHDGAAVAALHSAAAVSESDQPITRYSMSRSAFSFATVGTRLLSLGDEFFHLRQEYARAQARFKQRSIALRTKSNACMPDALICREIDLLLLQSTGVIDRGVTIGDPIDLFLVQEMEGVDLSGFAHQLRARHEELVCAMHTWLRATAKIDAQLVRCSDDHDEEVSGFVDRIDGIVAEAVPLKADTAEELHIKAAMVEWMTEGQDCDRGVIEAESLKEKIAISIARDLLAANPALANSRSFPVAA